MELQPALDRALGPWVRSPERALGSRFSSDIDSHHAGIANWTGKERSPSLATIHSQVFR